jgi:hypothetical protein
MSNLIILVLLIINLKYINNNLHYGIKILKVLERWDNGVIQCQRSKDDEWILYQANR